MSSARGPASPPPPESGMTTLSPLSPRENARSVWLGVYDRVSHNCFRVFVEDPLFLNILDNAVVPAAESDGSLPFEMKEFVEYIDLYERERQQHALAARRGMSGSSFATVSGGVLSASNSGGVGGGRGGGCGDPAAAVGATPVSFPVGATGSGTIYSGTSGGPTSSGSVHHISAVGTAAPLKLEQSLLRTLCKFSDFFFRVASVAYHLDPNVRSSPSSATGFAMPGSSTGVTTSGGCASVSSRAEGIASAAAGGVASLLTNTIAAATPAATPPRRNYSVQSGYSAAFQMCGRIFAEVYNENCRALAQKIASGFSNLRVEDCVKFRKAVWSGFHLRALEPYRSGAHSESNLELRWVSEKIKDDKHLFPSRGIAPPQQSSHVSRLVDATLSYVANARRRVQPTSSSGRSSSGLGNSEGARAGSPGASGRDSGNATVHASASGAAEENELNTFGLTKLLHNPSWQKDDESSDTCPTCGRIFISVARPLGTRAHHCRSCGIRLCVFCITRRAHYSFAKLVKPGSAEESDERLVCDACYKEYEGVSQLHYLGALFAFAGLGFSDLVLCRTVNEQWREAAELCISEYRLLLHNCDADLHSVKTPVGILLQNSLFLLLGDGPTSSIPVVHHPEAALLLLKYIATENLWVPDSSYYFISRLSSAVLNREDTVLRNLVSCSSSSSSTAESKNHSFRLPVKPNFSHWHLFCTAFCSKLGTSYFFVKCAELLCAAPSKVYDAYVAACLERMSRVYLSSTPLWKRLAEANEATAEAFQACHAGTAWTTPLPLPSLSDTTEGQVVTMWLLDMLHKDALVPRARRRYQQVLERIIPTVVSSSVSLVFIMLLSLQSTYSYYSYDEDLFGLWRTRIVAELERKDPVIRDRVVATLDFFNELDRFCEQSAVVYRSSVVEWIISYCARGTATALVTGLRRPTGSLGNGCFPGRNGSGGSARRVDTFDYVDLPHPILNPFKPYMLLRSIRLSGVKVAPNAASKPTWLAFSTWTAADHRAYRNSMSDVVGGGGGEASSGATEATSPNGDARSPGAAAPSAKVEPAANPSRSSVSTVSHPAPSTPSRKTRGGAKDVSATLSPSPSASLCGPAAWECMFLYKRENVERDQLMCISSRLLQTLLANEIGDAEMLDYSVLPLSCDSGLIERAEGRELSNLDNMDITSYVLHRGKKGCVNFLASAKLFLLLNYIFSIGDRHKGNVLMGTNGALLHIDFQFIFSEKTFVEKLARSTVRIDDAFLAAVEQCQLWQGLPRAGRNPATAAAAAAATPQAPSLGQARFNSAAPDASVGGTGQQAMGVGATLPTDISSAEIREAFFASAAEWFLHVRPFAAVFYELWLYAVHRHTVPYNEAEMLNMLNTLFDRHASQCTSSSKFRTTMKESVNVCRLKDVTHSSAEVLRSFADQVSRRVSEGSVDAVKMVGSMWSSWWAH